MPKHLDTAGSQDTDRPLLRSQLGSLLFLTAIFFFGFISRIILAPLMPTIEKDLGLSHGGAGSLFLLISSGYFISLIGSGLISSRLMHGRTIIMSAAAVGVTLLVTSFCAGLWGVRLGLFMLGLAAGLYLPSGMATLTAIVDSRHWGKAIAIHELAPNLAFVAAPLVSEALLPWFSWRGILALLGGASLLFAFAFARFGKGGDFPGEVPTFSAFKSLFYEPSFLIMVVLFSLAIGASLGVYAMLPLYLTTEQAMDRNLANTLIGLSRFSGLVMAFIAGWATDRLGARPTIWIVFLLTGLTTVLMGVLSSDWLVVIVFLQPTIAVCFFPAGFAALAAIGPASARNVAVSFTVPLAFVFGGGAIPTVIGIMGDAGAFSLGIILVGILIVLGFFLSLFLKLAGGNQ
ncbi:MAG: MFS transporter [Thermodesulfobacteriota bacterium]|nr:MFS transporter [Thermodesulfobacteriota bacterium]